MARKLEVAANAAIVVVALIAGVVLVRNLMARRAAPPAMPGQLAVGETLPLPAAKRVVLAVSTTCHFCSESAPFYKRLAATNVPMTVVLPQAVDEGRPYAASLGLTTPDVRQASMRSLKIRGTPTLLLVDGRGVVQRMWQGKLMPDAEAEVLASIR